MVVLTAATIITCSQVIEIMNRLQKIANLTQLQKIEIVTEIKKTIFTCPIIIQNKK